ncbi:uncharacterized protein LOC125524421 isoform X1 [Triticum urartu]|uniref:uncharacterized protein LOC125524421 isoform X1 n=2 Tax=Triticum urartu TaxID=4572 RepID=UPI002044A28B|nr:uncharacterized protein LOC125524421 isoform X1 [Triticum urartu]
MEGKRAPAAAPAVISAVLDDDDLLGEILLRLAFPTSLVRAALVCKRWLLHAAAPAFLRRFRGLHPPSLLGFYVVTTAIHPPRFVPLPQPPELADVVRRGSFDLDSLGPDRFDLDCWNGLLLLSTFQMYPNRTMNPTRVRCPLYPARDRAILPTVPNTCIHDDGFTYHDREILVSRRGQCLSYFCLAIMHKEQQTVVDVYALQQGTWTIYSSSVTEIPRIVLLLPSTLIGDTNKIYNVAFVNNSYKLILLDLVSASLSLVNFPEQVKGLSFELSLTDDSRLHLIHVKGFQLRIWLHKMDSNGVSNWFLERTVCLREICANYRIPTCMFKDASDSAFARVHAVGVNSEFVFLEMEDVLYLFDIKSKAAKKVYKMTPEDKILNSVIPFMMVWPPKFLAMKEMQDPTELP